MSVEKPTRYVIFGAGAIGIAIGALLDHAGSRVICVTRPDKRDALARGVTIKQDGQEVTAKLEAVTSASDLAPEENDRILITAKSQATEKIVEDLSAVYDKSAVIVCFQNGVRNEEIAAQRFENIYAGLVFMSAVQLSPELITMPRGRVVAIGCYPKGVDTISRQIADDLARAGLDAAASAHVMAMKWSKFIVNLNNATYTITGQWVEQGMADPEMRRLMLEVREEGLSVLRQAGIEFEPPPGEATPIRISEMNEKLKGPPRPSNEDLPVDERTYASMWQDLVVGRKSSEADFLNGDIVTLGRRFKVPTPYNSTLLEIINRMFAERLSPGLYTPARLRALILARATDSQY